MKNRTKIIAAACAVTLFLLIVIGGFVPVSHPAVSRRAARFIESLLAPCSVEIPKIRASAWGGIRAESVWIRSGRLPGYSTTAFIPRLRVTFSAVRLLLGRVSPSLVVVERPVLSIEPGPHHALRHGMSPPPVTWCRASLVPFPVMERRLRRLKIIDGTCRTVAGSDTVLRFSGLDAVVMMKSPSPLRLTASLSCSEVLAGGQWHIGPISARMTVRDTMATITRCRADVYNGTAGLKASIAIPRGRIEDFSLRLRDIDCGAVYREGSSSRGTLAGLLRASLSGSGRWGDLSSFTGKGTVELSDGWMKDLPVQKNLVLTLFTPRLSDVRFETVTGDVSFDTAIIRTPRIRGHGRMLDFISTGWIAMNGRLSQRIDLYPADSLLRTLAPAVRRALLRDQKERPFLRCRIRGRVSAPRVSVDREIRNRAVHEAVKGVVDKLRGLLR